MPAATAHPVAAAPAAVPAAAAPVSAATAAKTAAVPAAAVAAPAAVAAAPAAAPAVAAPAVAASTAGPAAGALAPAAAGPLAAAAIPAAAAGSASAGSGALVMGSIVGGVAVVGGGAAGVAVLANSGVGQEGQEVLHDLVAKQGDAEATTMRKVFTGAHEGRQEVRALLTADGDRDSGGTWTWSDKQEEQLMDVVYTVLGNALRDLEPQVVAVWQQYAGSSDSMSESRARAFVDDFFKSYVDSLVPNLLLTWIFLKEGPKSAMDVLDMPYEEAMKAYPLYAVTLESFLTAEQLSTVRRDWKGQDKPADLMRVVGDSVQQSPQQFIPQSETQMEFTVHRPNREEKVGLNAVGSDAGVFIVEIVPGSAAANAVVSGGGPRGLKAGMRVLEVAGEPVKSTADIGTAVVTSDGCPRMVFKVKVAESCARLHRINKVQAALLAEKVSITRNWLQFLCDKDGKIQRRRLLDAYNARATVPTEVNVVCKGWIAALHGPCVRYAKECIPKVADTPVGNCAVQ
eukprot:TRINITY_DN47752_c0_g1_i1.p1 TRINITY_DN47752_c0_g1~~TRINITY_DN47752_c0_g1_i1.p1  ORF type:complete len:562 (+),score=190.16 TRINITY_DN47752_c0_g1_i1:146-1687(+)